MLRRLRTKVLSEEKKVHFWLSWQRVKVSVRMLPSIKLPRQRFIRTRSSSRHRGQQSYRPAGGGNDPQLIQMPLRNRVMTSDDPLKEWQISKWGEVHSKNGFN